MAKTIPRSDMLDVELYGNDARNDWLVRKFAASELSDISVTGRVAETKEYTP